MNKWNDINLVKMISILMSEIQFFNEKPSSPFVMYSIFLFLSNLLLLVIKGSNSEVDFFSSNLIK